MAILVRKYVAPKESVYGIRWRQRKNILMALHSIQRSQGRDPAFQCFVTRQSINSEANRGTDNAWQPAPPIPITNTQMPFVAAEQFIRSLTDQGDFHVLPPAVKRSTSEQWMRPRQAPPNTPRFSEDSVRTLLYRA